MVVFPSTASKRLAALHDLVMRFWGQPPASIVSRGPGISRDKGPEVTETRNVAARDREIGVGLTGRRSENVRRVWSKSGAAESVVRGRLDASRRSSGLDPFLGVDSCLSRLPTFYRAREVSRLVADRTNKSVCSY